MGDLKWPGRMNWELSSQTKHGIGVWLQYGPVQLTEDISWYNSRSSIVCIIPRPNCTTFSLLFHHSVISARSRRIQLLMLFGIVLHCLDFGLAYLIGILRPITDLFCWTWNLPFSAFRNTLLPFFYFYLYYGILTYWTCIFLYLWIFFFFLWMRVKSETMLFVCSVFTLKNT